ncbi:MAG TPA: zinc-dependent metalloprotease [Actinomycetota bacterium]|jgi:coenzyme F420 biosynthesis associated uncharacterized protein|nr:zinc-dependent metalloprotease [Actinomycetota bacterium]
MPRLIEPWIARSVARRIAGDGSFSEPELLDRLVHDLENAVPRAEELVAAASGIPRPEPVGWDVIDRATWADRNIRGMELLLEPVARRLGGHLDRMPLPARVAQRGVLSVEVGALLGYVSRRVLGQYDLLVSDARDDPGALYFVGINMVEAQRRFGFVPHEFALWIAVHEVTHRFQFAGVPWLRSRFLTLVEAYLDAANFDMRSLASRLRSGVARLVSGKLPPEERNPVYLLSSPEQRAAMDDVQALMAVVEGHGNFVMDLVGEQVIPSFAQMRSVFERRREQTSRLQRLFQHAIGLEMKLRQYELGRLFCDRVVAARGVEGLSEIWTSPDSFPSLEEVRKPELWLARVAA